MKVNHLKTPKGETPKGTGTGTPKGEGEGTGETINAALYTEHLARAEQTEKAKRDRTANPTNKNSARAEVAEAILQVSLTGFGTTLLIHTRAKNLTKWKDNMVRYYKKHLKSQPAEVQKLAGSVSMNAKFGNDGFIELGITKNVIDIGTKDSSLYEKILNILDSDSLQDSEGKAYNHEDNEAKAYAILGMLYREGGIE